MKQSKSLFIYILVVLHSTFSFSQSNTDSLIQNLKSQIVNSKDDTTRINLLNKLAKEYAYTAPDTALHYAEQALALCVDGNVVETRHALSVREKGIANSYNTIGIAHWVMGNYEQALTHWQKALEIRKRNNDKKGISASLGNIGLVYWNQGNYPRALSYFFHALEIDSVMGNKRGIAIWLGNIGLAYWNQGNYPKALSYFFHALEMDSVLGNISGIAIHLGNIGNVYSDQASTASPDSVAYREQLFPKALSYYFKALEMDSVIGDKWGIAICLGNIGIVYHEQAKAAKSLQDISGSDSLFKKAISYYFQALEMDSVLGDKKGIAVNLGNIGSLYAEMKQYTQAEKYLQRSLALSDSIGGLLSTMTFEKSISDLYSQTNKWQSAFSHHVLYSNVRDTVFGEEKSKAVGRVEMKHELEMEELVRKRVEEEQQRQEAVAVERRNILQYSLILLVLGVLFVIVLYSRRLMAKLPDKILFIKVNKAKAGFAFIFIFIMMLFETLLLFADPYVTAYAQGAPGVILLLNALLACILFPVNFLLEKVLGRRVGSPKSEVGSQKTEDGSGQQQPPSNTTGILMGMVVVALFNSSTFPKFETLEKFKGDSNNRTIEQSNIRTIEHLNIRTKADSLINQLTHAKEDTQKVNLLNAIAWELRIEDEKQAMEYIQKGLTVAEKLHDERGKARLYSTLGVLHKNLGNFPAAIESHLKALKIDSILSNEQGIAIRLGNIGNVYKEQGNYPKALFYYLHALEMDSVLGNKSGIARHLGNIGIVYFEQGDYPKAVSFYFQSLEMDSVMRNKRGIARHLGNIGVVYMEQGNYPKALSYYFKALEMDSVLGNKSSIATWLGNIGGVYHAKGNYPNALFYYLHALEMDSVLGNKSGIARHLGNIGIVYYEQGSTASPDSVAYREQLFPKALSYYFLALEIDSVLGNKSGIARHLGNIGSLYTAIKQYVQAEKYLLQSLALSDSIGTLHQTMSFENSISELYAETGKWQSAYNHHVAYRTARDSLFGEEKSKAVGRVEMKHEMEMEEYRKKLEEEERKRQAAEAVGRRNELQYSAIFIGFFVLLGGIFILSRRVLPVWLIEFLTFVPFLILFEFILVLLDPQIDAITAGAPALRLLFNAIIAGLLYPLQQYSEHKLKMLFLWRKRKKVIGSR